MLGGKPVISSNVCPMMQIVDLGFSRVSAELVKESSAIPREKTENMDWILGDPSRLMTNLPIESRLMS